MEEISKVKEELPKSYQVINIERIDDFIFVQTQEKSFLIDKNKKVYDVGNYSHACKIYHMGKDIFAVLEDSYKQDLVNIANREVYLSHRASYYSGIWKIDDDYVHISGPDYEESPLFNIRTKKFIKPDLEVPVKYGWKLAPNLFVYENNDYGKGIYQKFIINQNGEVFYNCGSYFPYYEDGNIILSSSKDDEVIVVHDVLNGAAKSEMLSRSDAIKSNPLVYTADGGHAKSICFVSGKEFLVVDFNMNILKKYNLDIDYDDVEIQIWGDIAVTIVKKGEDSYCIALNIKTGKQVKHHGIWVLPLDVKGPTVIRGCDILGDDDYMFTIYDENGCEYTHHRSRDCFNIHSEKMNLIRFYGVEGIKGCLVYNIETKEEKEVPWQDPKFKMKNSKYMNYGFGIRYGESWRDEIIDIFDLNFNVVYEGIISKDFKIRGEDFGYEVKNELLLLTVPISEGPRTYYRKIVMDKEKNIIYDSFSGYLSFIGNFLQIIDEESGKTYYIDSRTGKRVDDISLTMQEFALPEMINIDGECVRLIKKNDNKIDEY